MSVPDAPIPAITSAGSPGIKWMRKNAAKDAPSATGTSATSASQDEPRHRRGPLQDFSTQARRRSRASKGSMTTPFTVLRVPTTCA